MFNSKAKMIKRSIPNTITLLNLISGCIGIVFAFNDMLEWSAYMIGIAAVFDFFDGFVARLLDARSEIGKQLDSFSDAVSFGVLPGIILFQLISVSFGEYFNPINQRPLNHVVVEFLAFILPAFSVLRLAKFNIDDRQTYGFIGMPTPASAILIGSLPLILASYNFNFYAALSGEALAATARAFHWGSLKFYTVLVLQDTTFLVLITLIISGLLVSPIHLIALKFKGKSWEENKKIYIFLIIVATLLVITALPYIMFVGFLPILDFLVIPLIIITYIFYSIAVNKKEL